MYEKYALEVPKIHTQVVEMRVCVLGGEGACNWFKSFFWIKDR